MSEFKFDNFAKGQVSGAVTAVQTNLTLVTGHGSRFPSFPKKLVIWQSDVFDDPQDAFNEGPGLAELAEQTAAPVGDTLTITRGVEGTSGLDMTDTNKEYSVMGIITAEIVGGLISWTNVVAFGATGDGITDDTLDVIAAFDAVADGGTVYFPVGTYNLATWPVAGQSYAKSFRVVGEHGSELLGPGGSVFLDVQQDVSLEALQFKGWDQILDLDPITSTVDRIRMVNCQCDGAGSAVRRDFTGVGLIEHIEIRDNIFLNSTDRAIALEDGAFDSVLIRGNVIDGGLKGIQIGHEDSADEDDWRRIVVTDNVVRNIANNAAVPSAINIYGSDAVVSGNIVDGVTGTGGDNIAVWIVARRVVCKGNTIKGISGATRNYGIANLGSDRASTTTGVAGFSHVITDNVIDLEGGEFGIFSGVEDVVIANNVVERCVTSAIHTQVENFENKRLVVKGNICRDGGASSSGIALENASHHVHVKDNIVENHSIGVKYAPNAASPQAYAPDDIQICGNTLIGATHGSHGIRFNPNTTNVTGAHDWIQVKDNYVEGFTTRWLSFDAGTFATVEVMANKTNGNGASDAILFTSVPTTLLVQDDGPNTAVFRLLDHAHDKTHVVMDPYHLWVDSSDRLRIKNGVPTSDTDGTIVGTQT